MQVRDQAEFERLLLPIEALLLNVIHRKAGNVAIVREIYHNAIVAGLTGFHKLRDRDKFTGWMLRIVHNEIANHFRRSKRETPVDFSDPAHEPFLAAAVEPEETAEEAALKGEAYETLGEAIMALPEEERMILYLYYDQELSLREIAETLGLGFAAVQSRKWRAIQKLKGMLKAP